MHRIEAIRIKINSLLDNITDNDTKHRFYIHAYGVSTLASQLAARRGLSKELAAVSGLLHDVSLIMLGDYETHAEKGAEISKVILSDLFDFGETEIISNSIRLHNEINTINSPYDEVLKDADILEPYFYDITEPAFPPAIPRLKEIMKELNIIFDV